MTAVDDLILISVDDHVIEPPDLFAGHLTGDYLERAPKLVRNEAGNDVWTFGDAVIENPALNAVAGRPLEEYGLEPQSLEEIRPGCYDVDERVKDMDAGGVLASMNFPSFPTFTARLFATDDVDFSLALVQAYNDWHIDEWCGAHPGRFIPMAVPAIWDPLLTADEVRRVAEKGCHARTPRTTARPGLGPGRDRHVCGGDRPPCDPRRLRRTGDHDRARCAGASRGRARPVRNGHRDRA
ncbi:MAG: amidohydrolase family protein, partial [Acidimicrobiales bacterium]